MLHDPPADPRAGGEGLADERDRGAERGADGQGALLVEGGEEPVLVPHGVAHDPQEAARELVQIEHRADLGREALEDRQLARVRV